VKFNHWGRVKMRHQLIEKYIPEREIEMALAKIDEEEYIGILKSLLNSKAVEFAHEPVLEKMNRLYRFAIGRGFEEEIVREIVKKL
jgi:regulatory protein